MAAKQWRKQAMSASAAMAQRHETWRMASNNETSKRHGKWRKPASESIERKISQAKEIWRNMKEYEKL